MNYLIIALAAFIGTLIDATIQWLDSGEPFNGRKYASGALRGLVSAVGWALVFQFTSATLTAFDILSAIAGGMAAGSTISAVVGKYLGSGSFPLNPPAAPPVPPSTPTATT